jgi:hypothetical protein
MQVLPGQKKVPPSIFFDFAVITRISCHLEGLLVFSTQTPQGQNGPFSVALWAGCSCARALGNLSKFRVSLSSGQDEFCEKIIIAGKLLLSSTIAGRELREDT